MERSEFKKRMQSLKSYREQNPDKGYWDWRMSLPDYLPYTNDLEYDMRGAYESGAQPELADDGLYHLPTRHSKTGKILKASTHPTYWKGLTIDSELGYKPYFMGNNTYTWNDEDGPFIPWQKVEQFKEGGQSQRRELGDSPYEDPRIEDRFKPRFELRKEPVNYYSNIFTKLARLARPVNVLGTIGEFVQNLFPSKEQEYLNDIDTYFDKQAREGLNISTQKLDEGGEVPPDNSPVRVNPFTKKPLANGSITPVLDLEDASGFTPIGDVLSIRDAYIAARNKDLLGLGLAGLGVVPFIPVVNRKAAQDLMDRAIRQSEKSKQVVDDFYTQRNNVYESMIENEDAFRRAAEADRLAGTNYVGVYGQNIRDYLRDPSIYNDNLPTMRFDGDLYNTNIKMQVDPRNPEYITVNPRYKDPDELDDAFKRINPGLVRHEMGHQTDLKAGLQYTDRLADPSKFVSDEKLKEMFPKTHTKLKSTVLNKGSEIKSYMNEFREFLIGERQWEPKESVKSFRRKLDEYSKQFPTLRMIFDSYKSKSDFVKDYNMVPLTDAGTNQNLV